MAYSFPEGASFSYAPMTSLGSPTTITSLTNASPTVCTKTTHGLLDNDVILLTTDAWPEAGDAIYKVDQLTADTFSPLGLDTTSTSIYPAGAADAEAAFYEVETTDWVVIPQVLTIATQGGDPRFTTVSPLARRTAIQVPTGFNPSSITLTLGYDSSNATIAAMQAIGDVLTKCAFKLQFADGGVVYGFGYMVTSKVPAMASGQTNQVTTVFTLLGRPMSYSS